MVSDFARSLKENIEASGYGIYQEIEIGDPELWIPSEELEELLSAHLIGGSLEGLPLRTRSKRVKEEICVALGYNIPKSFAKTQPKFLGQNFDVYTQKSNNLQIWNEGISPSRRYVLIRLSDESIITNVKVVTGEIIAALDTTGTLTQKYQARFRNRNADMELLSENDTDYLSDAVGDFLGFGERTSPILYPEVNEVMPIEEAYHRLSSIVGRKFPYHGSIHERIHGGVLHQLACEALGYSDFRDDGKFPDIKHQLIEVKLQTSPTIDLGVYLPTSQESLDIPFVGDRPIRVCDIRYAIFYGNVFNNEITITNLYLTTGADFFEYFDQFGGRVVNTKLQIPLPRGFL